MATETIRKGFENREVKNEFMNWFPIDEKTISYQGKIISMVSTGPSQIRKTCSRSKKEQTNKRSKKGKKRPFHHLIPHKGSAQRLRAHRKGTAQALHNKRSEDEEHNGVGQEVRSTEFICDIHNKN